jgi:hypothetical protein
MLNVFIERVVMVANCANVLFQLLLQPFGGRGGPAAAVISLLLYNTTAGVLNGTTCAVA